MSSSDSLCGYSYGGVRTLEIGIVALDSHAAFPGTNGLGKLGGVFSLAMYTVSVRLRIVIHGFLMVVLVRAEEQSINQVLAGPVYHLAVSINQQLSIKYPRVELRLLAQNEERVQPRVF